MTWTFDPESEQNGQGASVRCTPGSSPVITQDLVMGSLRSSIEMKGEHHRGAESTADFVRFFSGVTLEITCVKQQAACYNPPKPAR